MWFRQTGEDYGEAWRERFCSGYWYWSSIFANILALNEADEEQPEIGADLSFILSRIGEWETSGKTAEKILTLVQKAFAPWEKRGKFFDFSGRRERKSELAFLWRYLIESDSPGLFLIEMISNEEESAAVRKLEDYLAGALGVSAENGREEAGKEWADLAAYGRYLLLLLAAVRAAETDRICAELDPQGDFVRMLANTMEEYRSIDEVSERTYEIYRMHFTGETRGELGVNTYKVLLAKLLLDGEDHIYQVYEDAVREVCGRAWREASSAGEYRELVTEAMAENYGAYDFAHPLSFRFYVRAAGRPLAEVVSLEEQFWLWKGERGWEEVLRERVRQAKLEAEKARYVQGDFTREHLYLQGDMTFQHIHSGAEFEQYLKHIFTRLGYESELTKASGDQGADLILKKSGLVFVVQAKYYEKPVSNKAVQEAVAALKFYGANRAAVVTNNRYTKSAQALAKKNQVILLDGEALDELVKTAYSERAAGHMF